MLPYLIKRLASSIPTLLILSVLTFFLLRLAPGGPFDSDHAWPPEIQANILAKYELDRPVTVQFLHWIRDLVQGDLRESFQYVGRPVSQIIADSLPLSIGLGTIACLLAVGLGIPMGCVCAWKQNSWWDRSLMFLSVTGISLPSYLVASALILLFAFGLGWLPPALWDGPSSLVLPAITLASRPLAIIARLTRATMIETLTLDFIRTARGKGLPEYWIVLKHALKNSMVPVIALLGPIAANLLTGSFLVEIVFQLPGMGKYFVHAVLNRDYPLVMGVTLVYGVILILSNLFSDLATAWVDPRMRL